VACWQKSLVPQADSIRSQCWQRHATTEHGRERLARKAVLRAPLQTNQLHSAAESAEGQRATSSRNKAITGTDARLPLAPRAKGPFLSREQSAQLMTQLREYSAAYPGHAAQDALQPALVPQIRTWNPAFLRNQRSSSLPNTQGLVNPGTTSEKREAGKELGKRNERRPRPLRCGVTQQSHLFLHLFPLYTTNATKNDSIVCSLLRVSSLALRRC